MTRLLKLITVPLNLLYAKLYPVSYAKKLGVVMHGDVTIYGSSYISLDTQFVYHGGSVLPFRKYIPNLDIFKSTNKELDYKKIFTVKVSSI